MRITLTILLLLQFSYAVSSWGQRDYHSSIEINLDYGLTNDSHNMFRYATRTQDDFVLVENRKPKYTFNYTVAYSLFFSEEHAVKLSFGQMTYGINYDGIFEPSGQATTGSMQIRLLEWGTSYLHRFPISNSMFFIIEPGLRYHSDGNIMTDGPFFFRRDAFSFSGYTGIELPLGGDELFGNIGIQLKLPLQDYGGNFSGQQPFYPFYLGLRLGVNFHI